MNDRGLTTTLRVILTLGIVFALGGLVTLLRVEGPAGVLRSASPVGFLMVAVFALMLWVAASNHPRNPLLWVLAMFVLTMGTLPVTDSIMAINGPGLERPLDPMLIPADLPTIVAWTTGWSNAVGAVGLLGILTFGLLLFPDGRLPSRRWLPVAITLAIGLVVVTACQLLVWLPHQTVAPHDNPLYVLSIPFVMLGPPAALAGLVARFRKSNPEERAQFKWIVWGAGLMIPSVVAGLASGADLLIDVGLAALVTAYGVAITKYRLFDIDVVISKTLVFGSLAVFIGGVYVAVVVGVGSLFGSGDEPNAVLSVGATALVAVAFQPVRRRMERVANRVVFGRRATPYEVLSEFSRRVAATSDSLLDDAARSLAEGTRAERVAISIIVDNEPIVAASWPVEPHEGSAEPVSFPIADDDLTLGSLDVYLAAGQELRQDDQRLAEQLASGMGLALRNQLLTERLEVRVEELRESRRRLVAVQDETRRRLERDLHDGAQQQLVALKIKLGLGTGIAHQDGATQTAALLEQLSSEAEQTVDAMRDFARGVYPPLLEAEGLTAAIAAQARRIPLSVTVESDGIGRYPREIEATTYFCVQEAVRNIVQHANATHATVALNQSNGALEFHITDNGVGFDPTTTHGMGLVTMTDRLDAITGQLTIHTQPNTGTTIAGTIPIPTETPT